MPLTEGAAVKAKQDGEKRSVSALEDAGEPSRGGTLGKVVANPLEY